MQTCSVCRQAPKTRRAIDRALLEGRSVRAISCQFSVGRMALLRHKPHIPQRLAKAKDANEVSQADDLLSRILEIEAEAKRLARKAERAGDLRTAGNLRVRDLLRVVELLGRLRGELQAKSGVIPARRSS